MRGEHFIVTKWSNKVFGEEATTAKLDKKDTIKFPHYYRVIDDDGTPYFWGYSRSNSSFRPLDELGNAYGCVWIQYYENGEWKTL